MIPRKGEVHWRGAITDGAGKRASQGKVYLKLPPPFGEIAIGNGNWDGPSSKYANAGMYTYDLPVGAGRAEVRRCSVSHAENGRSRVHGHDRRADRRLEIEEPGRSSRRSCSRCFAILNVGLVMRVKGRRYEGPPDPRASSRGLLPRDLSRPRPRLRRRREARQRCSRSCPSCLIVVGFLLGLVGADRPLAAEEARVRSPGPLPAAAGRLAGVRPDRRQHAPPPPARGRHLGPPRDAAAAPDDPVDLTRHAGCKLACIADGLQRLTRRSRLARRVPRVARGERAAVMGAGAAATTAACSSRADPTTSTAPAAGRR